MTTKSNLHTHCTFCDGKNTIEEMIQAAIAAGLDSIGFSSHSPTGYNLDDCQLKDVEGYSCKEIADMLSLTEKQVSVYLFRARVSLKKTLIALGYDNNN